MNSKPSTQGASSSLPGLVTFLDLRHSNLKQESAAILTFLAIIFLIRFESIVSISTHYLGGFNGDASLYIYIVREFARIFPGLSFETPAFYPYSYSLAWSDNFILPAYIGAVLVKLGMPLVVSYNLLLLGANFLNGLLTYRLSFRLTGSWIPSIFAGAAFAGSSYFTWNLGHPQLQFAFFIPLSISLLFSAIATRSGRYTFLCGLSICAAFLSAVYIAVFVSMALAMIILAVVVLRPERFNFKEISILSGSGLLGLSPLFYFAVPYLKAREYFGGRYLYEAFYFSADILSYFSAPPLHSFLGFSSGWASAESHLFPGLVLILGGIFAIKRIFEAKSLKLNGMCAVACFVGACLLSLCLKQINPSHFNWVHLIAALLSFATILLALRQLYLLGRIEQKLGLYIISNRGIVAIFSFVLVVFFIFSLGPLGNPERHQFALGFHRLLFEIFPGVSSIRAICRSGIVVLFCLSILSALALASLAERSSFKTFVFCPLIAIVLLENLVTIYPLETALSTPPVLNKLNEIPNHGAIIGLPFSADLSERGQVESWSKFATLQGNFMHWFLETDHPTVNGYSGQRSWIINNFPRLLYNFPDKNSVVALSSVAGLRYILYCSSCQPHFNQDDFLRALQALESDLALISEDRSGNFLLELIGSTKITSKTFLLAPGTREPEADLIFSLMSPYENPPRGVEVALKLSDSNQVFTDVALETNGSWNQFQIPLAGLDSGVAPIKLEFDIRAKDSATIPSVFLKGTRIAASTLHSHQ